MTASLSEIDKAQNVLASFNPRQGENGYYKRRQKWLEFSGIY